MFVLIDVCVWFACSKSFYLSLRHHGKYSFYPLDLILAHWQGVQHMANNNNMTVKKCRWVTFCSAEWPDFNVGWPAGKTFNPETMDRVEEIVYCPCVSYPDQIPYIVTQKRCIDRVGGVCVSTGLQCICSGYQDQRGQDRASNLSGRDS